MHLTKMPVTELEYWAAIEDLGGFTWRTNHDLAHDRISDPNGSLTSEIRSAREIQKQLVEQLAEQFGVIPQEQTPQVERGQEVPPAPEGKIYYWDWYYKMRAQARTIEYEGIICSVCPFSGGLDQYIKGYAIPCTKFNGSMYRLHQPYYCGMVACKVWTLEELYANVLAKSDTETLSAFKQKEASLKEAMIN